MRFFLRGVGFVTPNFAKFGFYQNLLETLLLLLRNIWLLLISFRIYLLYSCWCIAFGCLNSITCALFKLFKPFTPLSLSLPHSGPFLFAVQQQEVCRRPS
jgi:hypothetical protein